MWGSGETRLLGLFTWARDQPTARAGNSHESDAGTTPHPPITACLSLLLREPRISPHLQSSHHVSTLLRGPHCRCYWRGRRSRQSVSLHSVSQTPGGCNDLIHSYSLLFASRGANVVVNDVSQAAAQKVVDEIVQGSILLSLSTLGY